MQRTVIFMCAEFYRLWHTLLKNYKHSDVTG